jgi:multiple sugar transport system permease protein
MTTPSIAKRMPRIGHIAGQAAMHIILITVTFSSVVPFVWMASSSLKPYKEIVGSSALLPHDWTLENYARILGRVGFFRAFANNVLVAVPVTVVSVLTSTLLGYVFAKYQFWNKEALFTALLATMMVPFTVVIIPLFITIHSIGLDNRLNGVIVTGLWSTFGTFMMRQAIETIPNDYIDAARVDGASEFWIVRQVIAPASGAAISALTVFVLLASWDNYLWPSIVLKSPDTMTLPLLLAGLRGMYTERYNLWAAGSMLTVVPVMLIYAVAQRHFIRGISMSGLKG